MYLSILQSLSVVKQTAAVPMSPQTKYSTKSDFIAACQRSNLPLSLSESNMLAELLSRKAKDEKHIVDISLLNNIKKGEFLNAPLY
jgi:hypothetical protein